MRNPSVSRCLESLKKNNINATYFSSGAEALDYLLRTFPPDATVGFGDSKTTRQIGLPRALHDRGLRKLSMAAWYSLTFMSENMDA